LWVSPDGARLSIRHDVLAPGACPAVKLAHAMCPGRPVKRATSCLTTGVEIKR